MSESTVTDAKALSTSDIPTKILHVCTAGITARVFLLPVMLRLRDEGYDVWCACTGDADSRSVADAGIPFFPVSISRSISLRDIISVFQLYRFIRKQRFTLVHTHTAKAGFTGRLAAWLAGVPVLVHTAHGLTMHEYLSRPVRAFYTVLERWIGRRTTKFITVTEKIRSDLIRLRVAPPENIVRIYNGIDFTRFSPETVCAEARKNWGVDASACIIGSLSRLVPDKGLEDLIDAFGMVHQTNPEVALVIAGDGTLMETLNARARDLKIDTHVRWLGWRDDVPAVLKAFDIFCLPTLREGFGYVFLEAQAMGVPVVATAIDPLTETMSSEETALLVPPHSPAELAAALVRLINDAGLCRSMAKKAGHTVRERFDQKDQLNAIIALYHRLLVGRI